MIRLADLSAQYHSIRNEIDEAIAAVLNDGALATGPHVPLFEQHLGAWCGAERVIGCSSGTAAIHLALCALGVGRGDEVIVPAYASMAAVAPIAQSGACIVLADINPQTYTLDPQSVAQRLSPRTRAIITVHMHGQMADLAGIAEAVRQREAYVDIIEYVAYAHGARQRGRLAGGVGRVGTFSFSPEANLGCYGEGGALVTNDAEIGERSRKLANHGRNGGPNHDLPGFNYRLDGMQAAILAVKLAHLEQWNRRRQTTAMLYDRLLADLPGVKTPCVADGNEHVYSRYVIEVEDREGLRAFLAQREIESETHDSLAVFRQPALRHMHHKGGALPVAERVVQRALSLPMHAELLADDVVQVTDAVRECLCPGSCGRRRERRIRETVSLE